jgi:hypothetical protein
LFFAFALHLRYFEKMLFKFKNMLFKIKEKKNIVELTTFENNVKE